MKVTDPIRRDHADFREHVDHMRLAARELPRLSLEEGDVLVGRVLDFCQGTLVPHAEAEEHVLYPQVAKLLGAPEATAPMIEDHELIREYVASLSATRRDDIELLQELLFGLHALVSAHLRKEEDLYLPLLDERAGPQVRRALAAAAAVEHPR
jgi:iron-sulfur cluster repair protein YtfE (RIC family)